MSAAAGPDPCTSSKGDPVRLRHEVTDAVEVFGVQGPVTEADADNLRTVLLQAVLLQPRGVLVDLTHAGPLPPAAVAALDAVRRQASGWPRPSLVLCCDPGGALEALHGAGLGPSLPVHRVRSEGFAHVDDRSSAPRRRFGVAHDQLSPSAARAAVADVAEALGITALSDDLALVVSELVTNAVRYAQPPLEVEIEATRDQVIVGVVDGSPGRPYAKLDSTDAEGGRGLRLVDLLATETGVRPQPPGKTMWAALARG